MPRYGTATLTLSLSSEKRLKANEDSMRYTIRKHNSTKGERLVYEVLKELHIPFKHRWLINGREVDFVFDDIALEVNGHDQDLDKNQMLALCGYRAIHVHNEELTRDYLIKLISKIYHGTS